ncbi:MAG: MetQ/NlpA family ABC transporter substrate-binding protein [Neisseriaceae bacterium]
MKKYFAPLAAAVLGLTLAACGQSGSADATGADKKEIKVGLPPSAHNVLMERLVKPALEKEGYSVKLVNFSSLRDANTALVEGGVDMNAAQHQAYLDVYNRETGNDLVPVVHIPSIPAALFSTKQSTVDAVKTGDTVLIPNDPSNAARSYALLAKMGWITLKPGAELATLTQQQIAENPHQLSFKEVDSALIPRMLDEVNYGIMPGGVAWLSKIGSDKALVQETFLPELELMVVVKKGDETTQWAQDVKKAYQSDELKTFIDTDPETKGWFVWPQG